MPGGLNGGVKRILKNGSHTVLSESYQPKAQLLLILTLKLRMPAIHGGQNFFWEDDLM